MSRVGYYCMSSNSACVVKRKVRDAPLCELESLTCYMDAILKDESRLQQRHRTMDIMMCQHSILYISHILYTVQIYQVY
jgi:hypothetical protein